MWLGESPRRVGVVAVRRAGTNSPLVAEGGLVRVGRVVGRSLDAGQRRLGVLAVQKRDLFDADLLRAGGLALVVVGATAEPFPVVLFDHPLGPRPGLRLTLRQR